MNMAVHVYNYIFTMQLYIQVVSLSSFRGNAAVIASTVMHQAQPSSARLM